MAYNKCFFEGNITEEPIFGTTSTGKHTLKFSIAVNRPHQKGKKETSAADFFNVTLWEKTAEFFEKRLHKGDMVFIVGAVRVDKIQGNTGWKTYVSIVADHIRHVTATGAAATDLTGTVDMPPEFDDDGLPY
jgi:single-strand DNA-binding protein